MRTVIGKRYIEGRWQARHPEPHHWVSVVDVSVMPVFDISALCAPDWFVEGCC